jgi:tellurite methyltransferase
VLGVDRLPDALRQARILARAAAVGPPGVARFRLVDLEEPRSAARLLKPRRFSVITCFRYLQREVLPLIEAALAPAGWLVYQTFLEEQARRGGRPHRPEFLLRPGELRDRFRGLTRIYYREGRDREGSWTAAFVGRRGRARVFPAGAEEAASVMIPAPSPSDPR